MQPLLWLVMIVKNEAKSLAKTLRSVRPFIGGWHIIDTGSTDDTVEIVERELKMPGIHGECYKWHHPIFQPGTERIDFAATRNAVLNCAQQQGVFTLMLSGDETLHGGEALVSFLEKKRNTDDGAFNIEMRQGDTIWPFPRILRASAGWRYDGYIHEVPVDKDGVTGSKSFQGSKDIMGSPTIPGCYVEHAESDKARHVERLRTFDLPTLQLMADTETVLYKKVRALMYLAQTHAELAEVASKEPGSDRVFHRFAAMAHYDRVSQLCTTEDSVKYGHYARFKMLNTAEVMQIYQPGQEMLSRLEPLAKVAPWIPEVKYMLARHAMEIDPKLGALFATQAADLARDAKHDPPPLPTDSSVEWRSCLIAAACAREVGNKGYSKKMAERGVREGGPKEIFAEFIDA